MSKQEDDAFAAWQANFAKEFESDPDAKAAWETLSGKAPDKVREHFYRGTLRQEDYHRRLNDVHTEKQQAAAVKAQAEALVKQNEDWWKLSKPEYDKAVKQKQVALALLAEHGLVGEGNQGDGGRPPAEGRQQMSGQNDEEFQRLKATLDGIAIGLPNYMQDFAAVNDELRRNNWSVGLRDVQAYSSTRGVSLQQALVDLTADERQKRQEDDIAKKIAAGVEEETRKRMASLPTPDYVRAAPRQSFTDMQKEMDALGDRTSQRQIGIELVREHLLGSTGGA